MATTEAIQIRDMIVRPAIQEMGLWSFKAELLVWGTMAHEGAGFDAIRQYGGGPALSWGGIEPDTYDDFFKNSLGVLPKQAREALWGHVPRRYPSWPPATYVAVNPYYAAMICRALYYRISAPIPDVASAMTNDVRPLADYWKKYYNTIHGAGTPQKWLDDYRRYCAP